MDDDRAWTERTKCPFTNCPKQGKHTWAEHWLQDWRYAPLPWVRRTPATLWHLAYGIRRDADAVSVRCRGGRFGHTMQAATCEWSDKPPLGRSYRDPAGRACRLCLSYWTKGVDHVSITINDVRVTKGQMAKLLEAIPGTDLMEIQLRPTQVEGKAALLATFKEHGGKDEVTVRLLVVGDGVVRL